MAYYTQPTVPNVADYATFLINELQIPATALPYALGAPSAPTLTPGTSGGSLASGSVYIVVTYISAYGETLGSTEASVAVVGPAGQVTVTSPPAVTNATGYNVYAASASGAEVKQNTAAIGIGTNYVLDSLATGSAAPPSEDTSGSPWITFAFNRAMALTLPVFTVSANDYVHVVYCCAAHVQIEITPDQPSQSYFTTARGNGDTGFNINSPISGVVAEAADENTSSKLEVPDAMKRLTFQDLQFSKTPWGRVWLGWGQGFGPVWGLT